MKFEYGELVIYQDDGAFPSLNGLECKILSMNKRMGYKMINVEFILNTGQRFEYEFEPKRLKKIKTKRRRFLWLRR